MMVNRNAKPRAMGLIVLDISHNISSTSTAAKATVEANVKADERIIVDREWPPLRDTAREKELVFRDLASPDKRGNNFSRAKVEIRRKVTTKGDKEKNMVVEGGILLSRHSVQSLLLGSMGQREDGGGILRAD